MAMEFDAFKNHIDLYSADLSRWPAEMVKPALALIDRLPEARQYFEREAALDRMLGAYQTASPDLAALEKKILDRLSAPISISAGFIASWRPAWVFAPSGGLLAAAMIGFIIGIHPAAPTADPFDAATNAVISSDIDIYEEGVF